MPRCDQGDLKGTHGRVPSNNIQKSMWKSKDLKAFVLDAELKSNRITVYF